METPAVDRDIRGYKNHRRLGFRPQNILRSRAIQNVLQALLDFGSPLVHW